jgi:hypothetical protein
MKILITGNQGLARSLSNAYSEHQVSMLSRSDGFDINHVDQWGLEFLDQDCVINCAYDRFAQIKVLEFFFKHWGNDSSKKIISIGSRSIVYKRLDSDEGYWDYRLHKQALQQAHDSMLLTARCDLKIINPGPIDTRMIAHQQCVKFHPDALALKIKSIVEDPTIKRIDLWL